jgi:hypothetical protein
MQPLIRHRGEEGSIALTMMVSFIATALTAAMLVTVFRDIRVSRRNGDSANALQIADAGINDAVKSLRNAVGVVGTCAAFPTLPGFKRTSTLAGGTYTYCAAQEPDSNGRVMWHVDAVATDSTGVERRLRADAASEPLFPNAINVIASGTFSAGFSVDSFKDEVNRCTKKGFVGTNSPESFNFGSHGNSSENCQNVPNGTFKHPPDGCIAYSRDGTKTIKSTSIGNGQCPPVTTTTASPEYSPPPVGAPQTYDYPTGNTGQGGNFTCDAAGELVAGKTYWYSSVTLAENCGFAASGPFPTMANPTKIYANSVTIAAGNGAASLNPINKPPDSAAVCGSTHGVAGSNPHYCPGWAGGLQVFVNGGPVEFSGNHSTFWGVITAPSSSATFTGGNAQWEIFGAMVARSVTGGVQAKWHYDENLGQLTSGRYFAQHWREEPVRPV